MKKTLLASLAAFGFAFAAGCNKSPEGGIPGSEAAFVIVPPTISTTIKPGQSETVKVDVNRKDAFNEAVTLTAKEVPQGLKVEESTKKADPGVKQVSFIVTAEPNAQPGSYVIKLHAKPEKTGKETLADVKVDVPKN